MIWKERKKEFWWKTSFSRPWAIFSRCVEMPTQRRTQGNSNECQQGALRGLLGVRPTDSLSCRGSQNLGKLAYRISNSRFFSILIAHRMRLPTNPVGRKTYLRVSRGPEFPLIGIWIDPPCIMRDHTQLAQHHGVCSELPRGCALILDVSLGPAWINKKSPILTSASLSGPALKQFVEFILLDPPTFFQKCKSKKVKKNLFSFRRNRKAEKPHGAKLLPT